MDKKKILAEFQQAQAILHGHFILSSGLHSDTYLQCAKLTLRPQIFVNLCEELVGRIKSRLDINRLEAVVSPALGGVVVGYEIGRQLSLPSMFFERKDGEFVLRRGFEIKKDSNILLVEDVVTTGKSSIEVANCIAEHGGKILAEACLVNRSESEIVGDLPLISLLEVTAMTYKEDEIPDDLRQIPPIKPGSRFINNK